MTTKPSKGSKQSPMTTGEKASVIRMLRYYGRLCSEQRLALVSPEVAEHRQLHLELWMQRARDALVGQHHLYDGWTRLVGSAEKPQQVEPWDVDSWEHLIWSLNQPVKRPEPTEANKTRRADFARAKAKAEAGDRLEQMLADFAKQQAADARDKERQRAMQRQALHEGISEQRQMLAQLLEEIRPKAQPAKPVVQCRRVLPWVATKKVKRVFRCSRGNG